MSTLDPWTRLRLVLWALAPCRAALLVIVAGVALPFASDQIQDVYLTAMVDWRLGDWLAFELCVVAWALAAWFWASLLIQLDRDPPADIARGLDEHYRESFPPPSAPDRAMMVGVAIRVVVAPLVTWVPRLAAASVPLGIALAMACATRGVREDVGVGWLGVALLVVTGALLPVLLHYRRRWSIRLADAVPAQPIAAFLRVPAHPAAGPVKAPGEESFERMRRRARPIVWGSLILALAVALGAWVDPVWTGLRIGNAANALMVIFVCFTIGLSRLTWFTERYKFPFLSALVIYAVALSVFYGGRELRSAAAPPAPAASAPPVIAEVAKSLPAAQPVVIVAAAGGGMRAAYWTASVLAHLQDASLAHGRRFDQQLFAVTSVSGGSYGAVVYRALLTRHLADGGIGGGPVCNGRRGFVACAAAVLGPDTDSLAPTLITFAFGDLVGALLPVSVGTLERVVGPLTASGATNLFGDRASALEKSWEHAWQTKVGAPNLIAGRFDALWPDGQATPALLLNGTSVQRGRRIITANVGLHAGDGLVFPDALAVVPSARRSFAASTAVNNSARFPIIGPAVQVAPNADDPTLPFEEVVDGGYFENDASATALDLLGLIGSDAPVLVIQITSDPDLPSDRPACVDQTRPVRPFAAASLITTPVDALYHTRAGRAAFDRGLLERTIEQRRGGGAPTHYAHLRLSTLDGVIKAPLGWALSKHAVAAIERAWDGDCNDPARRIIAEALGYGGPARPVPRPPGVPIARADPAADAAARREPDTVASTGEPSRSAVAQPIGKPVLFAAGQSALSTSARVILGEAAIELRKAPAARVIVEGHTDIEGTPEHDDVLGLRRAEAVIEHLVRLGVPRDRLVAVSFGAARPVPHLSEEMGRRASRRVVIVQEPEERREPAPEAGSERGAGRIVREAARLDGRSP